MTPTPEEKQWLQEYLHEALSYRETYAEVYDHMLLALEDRPAREFFASTVNDIIEEDFGGSINMLNMEAECTHAVKADIISQYGNNISSWFKFTLIIYTAATFFSLYYLAGKFLLVAIILLGIGFLLPIVMFAGRGFIVGYKFGDAKTSIKDEVLRKITYMSFVMFWFISAVCSIIKGSVNFILNNLLDLHFSLNKAQDHMMICIIISLGILMLMINAIAIFKLYRDEFKSGMITN